MWSGNVNKNHNNLEDIITGRNLNYLAFKIPKGSQQWDQLQDCCPRRGPCLVFLAVEANTGWDGAPMQGQRRWNCRKSGRQRRVLFSADIKCGECV